MRLSWNWFVRVAAICILIPAASSGQSLSTSAPEPARVVPSGTADVQPKGQPKAAAAYGNLPLSFEANVGQTNPSVRYLARGVGYQLFLTDREAVFSITQAEKPQKRLNKREMYMRFRRIQSLRQANIRMRLKGAIGDATIVPNNPLSGKINYMIGKNPEAWHLAVPNYGQLTYKGVYPGIDMVFRGTQGKIEYDFVVAPRGNPNLISIQIAGEKPLWLDTRGDLHVETSAGTMIFQKPLIYQTLKGQKKHIDGAFAIRGADEVAINVGRYDGSKSLTIDPVLVYSGYFGGTTLDGANDIALDSQSNAYLAGWTMSTDFPLSSALFSTPPVNTITAFVTKFDASGQYLIYSTYLGGSVGDIAGGIAVDANGSAYITGETESPDFPVTTSNCFQANLVSGATSNAFLTKISPDGQSLQYSTFLGGAGTDGANKVAVDNNQNAYLVGYDIPPGPSGFGQRDPTPGQPPPPPGFPTTSNAYQQTSTSISGGDVFVTRIDTTQAGQNSLIYSTFLGGNAPSPNPAGGVLDEVPFYDAGFAIAVDANANVYVAGATQDTDFPITTGTAYQTSVNPNGSAFLTRIDTTQAGDASLIYSTALSGSVGGDAAYAVALDSNGYTYIAGDAESLDFPVTTGVSNNTVAGKSFVAKFDTTQSQSASLLYSTLVGGSVAELADAIAVDPSGRAYVGGFTVSPDFPVTPDALQSAFGTGGEDSFLAVLSADASQLLYATYLGGTGSAGFDILFGIALDPSPNPNIYIAGVTASTNFQTTPTAYQPALAGPLNCFIAELSPVGVTAPVITSLSTIYDFGGTFIGMSGTDVTINGTSFGSTQGSGSVHLGGVAAPVSSWSDTTIVVSVPINAPPGFSDVAVSNGLVWSNSVLFVVVPAITSLSPVAGPVGATVDINGANLGVSGSVTFNGTSATTTSWSPTIVVAIVPPGATTGDLIVTSNNIATSFLGETIFTVTSGPVASGVSAISPTSGPANTSVTITGSNFGASQGTGLVTFGGVNAAVSSWSDSTIVAAVPATAEPGTVSVGVNNGAGWGNYLPFTIIPNITQINPPVGPIGTTVSVLGTNFGTTGSVTFGGVNGAITSWTLATIVVTVPTGATTGNVVVTSNSVSSAGTAFVVGPVPTGSSGAPGSGSGSSTENQLSPATNTGLSPYSDLENVDEEVNLANGDVHVFIPLVTIPERNGQKFILGLPLDSHNTYTLQESTTASVGSAPPPGNAVTVVQVQWAPSPSVGQTWNIPELTATRNYMGSFPTDQQCGIAQGSPCGTTLMYCTTNWVFTDDRGGTHEFNNSRDCSEPSAYGPSGEIPAYTQYQMDSTDGSYMRLDVSNATLDASTGMYQPDFVVYTTDGTQYHFTTPELNPGSPDGSGGNWYASSVSRITDRNGNALLTFSPNEISNGLGRTITFTSAAIQDSNGQTFTITTGTNPSVPATFTPDQTYCNRTDYQGVDPQQLPVFGGPDVLYSLGRQISILRDGGLQYSVQTDTLGGIIKVTYPGGGYTRYDYQTFGATYKLGVAQCTGDYREVIAKHVCGQSDGACSGSAEATTTYSPDPNSIASGTNASNTVVDPLGNRMVAYFMTFGYGDAVPKEYLREIYSGQSTLLRAIQTQYSPASEGAGGGSASPTSVPIQIITTLADVSPALTKTTLMQYEIPDSFCYGLPNPASSYCASGPNPPSTGLTYGILMGNPTQIDEYDYDGSLKRTTVTVWQRGGNFQASSGHILDRPQTRTVTDPLNSVNSVTSYSYDSTGNPLSVTRSGTGVSPLVTHYAWDSYGNLTQATDPKGNLTMYGYTDSWADAGCTPSSTTYGFLTSTTNAKNQTTSYQNYSCSGLGATATDPNGLVTTFNYDDHDRLIETDYPDGGYTRNAFVDTAPQSATTTQLIDELARTKVSTVLLDGLTRKVQSQLTSDPQGTDYIDTAYDPLERVATVSNPYRSPSDSTYGVTTHNYDPLNRPTLVVQPDGSSIRTSYCGKATLLADEAGKWRRNQTDALGRLIEVDEPNSLTATVSACPASGDPVWATTYTYDGFDDLTAVAQGEANPRTFVYDAFHRLTQATNPETGQVSYEYDPDGNVSTKTDPRGAVGSYTYDPLNRVLSQSFTPDGNLGATFNYDESNCPLLSQCANIGHLTSIIDQNGGEVMGYDPVDRLALEYREISGVEKFAAYSYNYDHSISGLLYPSGTVVDYTVDSAGRPSVAQDGSTGTDYVQGTCANGLTTNGVCYGPQGAISQMLNGTDLTTTTIYNNRLQPCWIYATTTTGLSASTLCGGLDSTPGSVLDLQYNYNWATQDNGNVLGITNNRDTTRSQTFAYDQVNRVATAQTNSDGTSSPTHCWGESYTYDRWGNITAIASPSTSYNGCTQETAHTWQFSGNQISTAGYQYDAAGNMLSDGLNAYEWYSQGSLADVAGQSYMYDGQGNRVGKIGSKLYWYGLEGQVLDESDTSGNITDEYVYFGSGRVAHLTQPDSTVYYYAEDQLGTSRAMLQDGQTDVCYDADFYPFGGERPYADTCSQDYKFTGKERDTESGNDYFGARYYDSTMGRFMSPDWASDPTAVPYANFGDPQSLNLYSYTRNNPLRATDPEGHCDGPGCALSVIQAVQQFAANPGEYIQAFVAGAVKQQLSTALSNWGVTPGPALSPSNDVERAGAAALTTGEEVGAAVILPLANFGEGGGAAPETFMGPKEGSSGGEGAGQPFSPETKQSAVDENAAANGGAARCVYCGQKVTNEPGPNKVNIDHSDAKSKGGNDTLNNAQVTCQHCNQSKGTGPAPKTPKPQEPQ